MQGFLGVGMMTFVPCIISTFAITKQGGVEGLKFGGYGSEFEAEGLDFRV